MQTQPTMHNVANISRTYIWVHRIVVGSVGIMLILAAIFCIVKGSTNNSIFFMLFVNILLSALITSMTTRWYIKGDIGMENHWVLVAVSVIIIWQCIATDIYVFNVPLTQIVDTNNTNVTSFSSIFYTPTTKLPSL